ncbi:hypothetical protein OH76DRAFT_993897 [Lentinus brumalis]|uniref:Uncharacterized protein n=1 Tax=Lentinus brumalis TaxID=2498619 RepID=A0A371DQC2_9APHY|nr:hypothetical protein OH76DRAFT_993897 [Polyporus brumalis]
MDAHPRVGALILSIDARLRRTGFAVEPAPPACSRYSYCDAQYHTDTGRVSSRELDAGRFYKQVLHPCTPCPLCTRSGQVSCLLNRHTSVTPLSILTVPSSRREDRIADTAVRQQHEYVRRHINSLGRLWHGPRPGIDLYAPRATPSLESQCHAPLSHFNRSLNFWGYLVPPIFLVSTQPVGVIQATIHPSRFPHQGPRVQCKPHIAHNAPTAQSCPTWLTGIQADCGLPLRAGTVVEP